MYNSLIVKNARESIRNMKHLFVTFDLNNGDFFEQSQDIYKWDEAEYTVLVFGKINVNDYDVDGELLWIMHQKYKNCIVEHLHGQYILVVFDKKGKKMYVYHDRTTSPVTLYYTMKSSKMFLSTSLKRLLKESNIVRALEESVLEEFLVNGFIYGKKTLIKNVYKLEAFRALVVQNGKVESVSMMYTVTEMSKGEALDKWESVLSKAIQSCFADKKEINMPLSSGFDSNYIAHIASTESNLPINAFSIGGKFGKNELPVVKENVSYYRGMQLYSSLTDSNTLSKFPDIVWRLEGAVYEVGVFLQYELARLVAASGKKNMICGECADQVMNLYYLEEERIHPKGNGKDALYYEFSEYPYIFGSYLILKKSGILANSFGIETEYPFLDDNFISIAHTLRNISGKDKRVHTAFCRERLHKAVVTNMTKTGGATEFHSLFNDRNEINRFYSAVEQSEFYTKYETIIKKISYIEKEKQFGITKLKTTGRNLLMDIMHLNKSGRKKDAYFFEEIKLKEYMNCMYVILFEKLFISGQYDEEMYKAGITDRLDDMI